MRIAARAKINLSLEVLGLRPDGYHDLRSVVMPISLCDTVELKPAVKISLSVTSTVLPDHAYATAVDLSNLCPPEENLAMKAARLMKLETGHPGGVAISISKRIPLGGGLGGGSADAAAVLVGLNQMWKLGLTRDDLVFLGAQIGSDVPALVFGGTVLMEGRGERVSPVFDRRDGKIRPLDLVLANPGVHSSTPEVFRRWRRSRLTKQAPILNNIRSSVIAGNIDALAAVVQNDLTAAAFARYPEIERTAHALKDAGAIGVSLSGSGATVFGFVRSPVDAWKVQRKMSGAWTALARTCPVV